MPRSAAGGRRFRTRGLPSVDELRTDGLDPVPVLEFGGGCRLAVDPVGGRVVVEDGVPVEELGELETLHGGVPVEEDRRTCARVQGLQEMVGCGLVLLEVSGQLRGQSVSVRVSLLRLEGEGPVADLL